MSKKCQIDHVGAPAISKIKFRPSKLFWYIERDLVGEFFSAQTKPERILQSLFKSSQKKHAIFRVFWESGVFWVKMDLFLRFCHSPNKKDFLQRMVLFER